MTATDERSPDRVTLAAFVGIVLVMGMNAVAIRFSNRELDPLWGATLRFGIVTLLFVALVVARRAPLPRGEALRGVLLWGALGFGAAYGLMYVGLVQVTAALGQIVLATVPLLTLLFAASARLERLTLRGVGGALVATAGIALAFRGGGVGVGAVGALVLVVLAAASMASSNVVLKRAPRAHPLAANAIGMGVGTVLLLAASALRGETMALPVERATWIAVLYLVATSAIGFMLFLFVMSRWTASATSYILVLMPFVTVAGASALAGEPVTPALLAGLVVVVLGVWLGALSRGRAAPAAAPPEAAAAKAPR